MNRNEKLNEAFVEMHVLREDCSGILDAVHSAVCGVRDVRHLNGLSATRHAVQNRGE